MKIKFIFELNNGTIVTNDNQFNKNDEEDTGCVVDFDKVPMLQDYQEYVNELWCGHLQFNYMSFDSGTRLKKVITEIVE